ncbi:Olfactory receptor 7E24 [Cricetulus griseus]|uniref:Olfactory receptor 7E24 n=1 Tax=Cricetulus griseus TaxID=10029 RepID=G3HWR1_CRIGR|nr:Olfactory receptor 7E24 [Cricetulus griseus]
MYILALFGNLLIILTVSSDSHLHTPMYFFLSNLSMVDIGFISTTVPRVIVDIQTHCPAISYVGCLTQMSLFVIFACMDDMLLVVMAYDRFVAICHPLHYQVIMNPSRCGVLLLACFLLSLLELLLLYVAVLNFSNCEDYVEISNFFCGSSEVLKLACFDTVISNIVRYCVGTVFGILPISGIIFSYYKIVSSIMRSSSSSGKHKAFSTCGSHLSIVCLFYGTALGVYVAVLNFSNCEDYVEISNFFCGSSEVLKLACFDTVISNIVRYCVGTVFGILPISGIIFSYYKIVSSIMRSSSSSGKHKAFSTCGSHLSIVCLFYGTALGVYFSSSLSLSPKTNAVASVMYTVVTPMLNPFIYSLRNKDIKTALRKILSRTF